MDKQIQSIGCKLTRNGATLEDIGDWVDMNDIDLRYVELKSFMHSMVTSITRMLSYSNVERKSHRFGVAIVGMTRDMDGLYTIRSLTKTRTALIMIGAKRYTTLFESGELKELQHRIDEHAHVETLAGFDKKGIREATYLRTHMHMPGTVFKDEIRTLRNDSDIPVKIYLPDFVISVLDHLRCIGFEGRLAADFLALVAIHNSDFATNTGIDGDVNKIIDTTMEAIKDIIYMRNLNQYI